MCHLLHQFAHVILLANRRLADDHVDDDVSFVLLIEYVACLHQDGLPLFQLSVVSFLKSFHS